MKITFGMDLDGAESLTINDSTGAIVCGPLRLTEILETHLGLRRKPVSDLKRQFQFVKVLEAMVVTRPRFYSASFEKDSLAVAETLLDWRDSLVMAGWDGLVKDGSGRLLDLAALQAAAQGEMTPGRPDRLVAIREALGERQHGIEELVVVDPSASFPKLWRDILTRLGAKYVAPEETFHAAQEHPPTDLQQLAATLRGNSSGKIRWRNDGSVVQYSAFSEFTLAHYATECLREHLKESCTLIAENDCQALDDIRISADQASLGVQPVSRARPIPQLLLLALRLCWKPVNPLHLLEFLTHPNCPVEFHLRNELARALVESPGVGGTKWFAAIETVKTFYQEHPEESKGLASRLEQDLTDWIHISRYDGHSGMPGPELAGCCRLLAKWARQQNLHAQTQLDDSKAAQFQCLAAQAAELGDWSKEIDTVKQCQLEQLVRRVTGNGWAAPKMPEVGHCHRAGSPVACIKPVETVLWWNFSEPPRPTLPHWTETELQELQRQGAEIPSAASILAGESAQWLRPILAARKRLLLFTPRQRNGEPVAAHPLLSRMQAVAESRLPTLDLDLELQRKRMYVAKKIAHTPLPVARRWWRLKDGSHLEPRAVESFSSAEKFIYSPYAWVLDYKAVLRPGVLSQFRLQSESVLRGNLLHRLLDLLADGPIQQGHWNSLTEADFKNLLDQQWPVLLEQEGAAFLLLGKQSQATALLSIAKQALWALAQQLRTAQTTITEINVPFQADFAGGRLHGYIDLLVKNEKLQSAVVDLKSGRLDDKKKELQGNVPLQLAIYGYLHKQNRAEWPSSAYFILNSGRMLAQTKEHFPLASEVPVKAGPAGLEVCWVEFLEMWRYRRSLLDQGCIEMTLGITEPQNGDPFPAVAPFEHWLPGKDQDQYNDFNALTGMEVNA